MIDFRRSCALVFMTSASATALASGCWTQKADFPFQANREPSYTTAGGGGYVGGGQNKQPVSKQFYRYDLPSDTWTRLANLPGSFSFLAPMFPMGSKPAIVVGTQMFSYTDKKSQWKLVSNTPTPNMEAAFAFTVGTVTYMGGGFYNGVAFWKYDANSKIWTQLGNSPAEVGDCTDCSSFKIGDFVYVSGTNIGFWRYDSGTDSWASMAFIDNAYGNLFSIGKKGYLLSQGILSEYNVAANSWAQVSTFPGANVCYPAVNIEDGMLVLSQGGLMKSNSCSLDPSSAVWTWAPKCAADQGVDD
jgi:N-acetylneuraminic acid mutarotase